METASVEVTNLIQSTQASSFSRSGHKKWIFSSAVLDDLRHKVNEEARQTRTQLLHKTEEYLSVEEEQSVRFLYEKKIQQICTEMRFFRNVSAAALVFFKRFFLFNSLMMYNPNAVITTSIYLAWKAEEAFYIRDIDRLFTITKTVREDIVKTYELKVLDGCNFNLRVYHPFRALEAFRSQIQQFDDGKRDFRALVVRALVLCEGANLTDAALLYAPSQLALGALLQAGDEFKTGIVKRYLESVMLKALAPEKVEPLRDTLQGVVHLMQAGDIAKKVVLKKEMKKHKSTLVRLKGLLGQLDSGSSNTKRKPGVKVKLKAGQPQAQVAKVDARNSIGGSTVKKEQGVDPKADLRKQAATSNDKVKVKLEQVNNTRRISPSAPRPTAKRRKG